MTGMPSSEAFFNGRKNRSESIARMRRTFAPFEIRLSTSASCLVGDPCASAEMYFAPALSRTALIAASSVFQRSSWKFDQETPTVRSFASAASDVTLAEASKAPPNARFFNDFTGFLPWDAAESAATRKARAPLQPKPNNFRERHNGQRRADCQ